MPRSYPAEVRRQVVELARAVTKVKQLAATFQMSDVKIYSWFKPERIDRGEAEGQTTSSWNWPRFAAGSAAHAAADLAGRRDRRRAQGLRRTCGANRVTAELRHGRDIVVGHNAVEAIMRQLGIRGLPTRRLPCGPRCPGSRPWISHPRSRLRAAAARLPVGSGLQVGLNRWYLAQAHR